MSPLAIVRGRLRFRSIRFVAALTALVLALGLGAAAISVAAAAEPRRVAEREVARSTVDRARDVSSSRRNRASAVRVVRGLYAALSAGDVPGVAARLHPDVVVDEPLQLPWGGVHYGRDAFIGTVLGGLARTANITIIKSTVYEGAGGRVVGTLVGTLTAHTTGETYPITFVELHEVKGGTVRRMDIYVKDPVGFAAFVARSTSPSN